MTLSAEQVIPEFEAWLHFRAHQMIEGTQVGVHGHDHDDLVQVGRIAMWQALEADNHLPGTAWLTVRAENRMRDALRAAPTKRQAGESLDLDRHDVAGADPYEAVVEAYHHGEIAEAIAGLTPAQQRYVRLRFWGDRRTAELKQEFGYDPNGLWNSQKNGAKRKLRERLAHLAT